MPDKGALYVSPADSVGSELNHHLDRERRTGLEPGSCSANVAPDAKEQLLTPATIDQQVFEWPHPAKPSASVPRH